MSDKQDLLSLLQSAIEQRHGCIAVHRGSIHVRATFDSRTIWIGNVEIFGLDGHTETDICYAWWHRQNGTGGNVLKSEDFRLITVLGKRPVDSPEMAVRTAIFYDVQPVSGYKIDFGKNPLL